MIDVTLVYILCPIMLHFKKKILRANHENICLQDFRSNWTQIVFLPQKEICLENWPMLLLSTYYAILQQLFYKILRVDHQISKAAWLWAKLGPICPFALKEDFMGKITNVTFVYLLCLIMPLTFKKVLGGNQEISVCTLGPNWPFTQKCKSLEIIDFSLLIVCNHTRKLKKSCEYHEE